MIQMNTGGLRVGGLISLFSVKKRYFGHMNPKRKMNEVFFYDPYKEKTDMEMTIDAMHQTMLAIKAFGIACKQATETTKEMNNALQYLGRSGR